MPGPGEPDYISVEEHPRLKLARSAEYEARPHVICKHREDAESQARSELERNAKRKHPKPVQHRLPLAQSGLGRGTGATLQGALGPS